MIVLIIFAFIAGIVTILSPCVLPVLPIILFGSVDSADKKRKPLGIITGFVLSFTFFTLFLSSLVKSIGIPAQTLRLFSVYIIGLFGIFMLFPKLQTWLEIAFSKLSNLAPNTSQKHGFTGGVVIGLSLGLLWTPCVGPILASVISLAAIGEVTLSAFFITLAYSLGTAIPMLLIMLGGKNALQKFPNLAKNTVKIQKFFGVLMILTSIAIFFNLDRKFQTYILNVFPNYGTGLTQIEDQEFIKDQLQNLNKKDNMKISTEGKVPEKSQISAPKLITGGEWFNSEPLQLSELQGKVVLIDFWTYSCINCQRTLPYLTSWWEKYKDDGLVIIGVHTPEFEFEKEPKNVKKAMADFGIQYPVMQDNDFKTWRNYSNRYWPAKYLIDKDGYIRYTHFGEGQYAETESVIQGLLAEAGSNVSGKDLNKETYKVYSQTPELYLGYKRMEYLSSPERVLRNKFSQYTRPDNIPNNTFAFTGNWLVAPEYSNPQEGSVLYLNFESKKVFLVMNPKNGESKVRVSLDGEVMNLGKDVQDGVVTIDSDSLYELIDLPSPGRHILKLEFLDDNTEIYAFTFG